jgi:apolipoprotein N-acyltransferase
MSFLLLLFPAAVAVGVHLRRTAPRKALRITGTGLGVIAAALIFGVVRLALPVPPGRGVTVALVSSDEPGNTGVVAEGAAAGRLFRDYAEKAEKLAARGARIIVLPEKLAVMVDPDTEGSDALFQSLAEKTKSTIIVGLVHVSAPAKYNQARVYAPGAPVLRYDKHHMLPPFESDLKPGTTLTLLPEHAGTWGVAICKDMDFTQLSGNTAKRARALCWYPRGTLTSTGGGTVT